MSDVIADIHTVRAFVDMGGSGWRQLTADQWATALAAMDRVCQRIEHPQFTAYRL